MKRSAVDRPPVDVGGTRRFVDGAQARLDANTVERVAVAQHRLLVARRVREQRDFASNLAGADPWGTAGAKT